MIGSLRCAAAWILKCRPTSGVSDAAIVAAVRDGSVGRVDPGRHGRAECCGSLTVTARTRRG